MKETQKSTKVVVNQALVERIVAHAKASRYGINDDKVKPSIANYEPQNLETLALCMVSAYHEKYDLVSIFQAAFIILTDS